MLIVSRRAGESLVIGENIEILIVDVDGLDLKTRCAISVRDEQGNEVPLQRARTPCGTTVVRAAKA